ncbi:5E5 antigen-like isoform X2 [Schistocerca serialis cubense]|uniref:5E5 antigen-like isoform X2 n=1 Tax=Schistocerca serialis cubense TaxID=2023355 RepID=UPI00214E3BC8|nr:5E5 antigen-like isoform X2 [Schistocerca serialis cubense]XP_049945118.1 5E5 antigen-like isoform X2 [Schistocerca serialis cubense]
MTISVELEMKPPPEHATEGSRRASRLRQHLAAIATGVAVRGPPADRSCGRSLQRAGAGVHRRGGPEGSPGSTVRLLPAAAHRRHPLRLRAGCGDRPVLDLRGLRRGARGLPGGTLAGARDSPLPAAGWPGGRGPGDPPLAEGTALGRGGGAGRGEGGSGGGLREREVRVPPGGAEHPCCRSGNRRGAGARHVLPALWHQCCAFLRVRYLPESVGRSPGGGYVCRGGGRHAGGGDAGCVTGGGPRGPQAAARGVRRSGGAVRSAPGSLLPAGLQWRGRGPGLAAPRQPLPVRGGLLAGARARHLGAARRAVRPRGARLCGLPLLPRQLDLLLPGHHLLQRAQLRRRRPGNLLDLRLRGSRRRPVRVLRGSRDEGPVAGGGAEAAVWWGPSVEFVLHLQMNLLTSTNLDVTVITIPLDEPTFVHESANGSNTVSLFLTSDIHLITWNNLMDHNRNPGPHLPPVMLFQLSHYLFSLK